MKKNKLIIFIYLLLAVVKLTAQEWTLKFRSSVELRTFKLTNKADILEEKLGGAMIALYKGSTLVNQIQSDGSGDFVIDVPANGDFILTVSYSGCNSKKFAISTMNVPVELGKDNYKPTFGIEGVIMAKAFPTIDYSVLNQPLAKIVYTPNGKKFDDEQAYTNQMLGALSRINEAENALIQSFVTTNNNGDIALSKGDCPLAKASYEKALTIIVGESYPRIQLPKVGDCLKNKDDAAKKDEEANAAKAAAAKLEAENAEADRLAKEKAAKEKVEADKFAKEKTITEKAEADRLIKENAEVDRIQSAKLAGEKSESDKIVKEKVANEKAETVRLAKEKTDAIKTQSAKQLAEKAEANRLAKEKIIAEKIQSDKQAKEKTVADRIAKEKVTKEKTDTGSSAKAAKAEAERIDKEKTTTPVQETSNGIAQTTGSEPGNTAVGNGEAKYSTPKELGVDTYKATIKRADELFKMKRYAEAKPMYEQALKQKPNDVYATNKLTEIEKFIKK